MKVREIMSTPPSTCTPDEDLGTAVWRMYQADCGFLPVTSGDRVVGVITDRDVAITLMLRGRTPSDVTVGEMMQGTTGVVVCEADDPVHRAMDLMRDHQLHRLPVMESGTLVGVLSLNDVALAARANGASSSKPSLRDVAKVLQSVCAHRIEAAAA